MSFNSAFISFALCLIFLFSALFCLFLLSTNLYLFCNSVNLNHSQRKKTQRPQAKQFTRCKAKKPRRLDRKFGQSTRPSGHRDRDGRSTHKGVGWFGQNYSACTESGIPPCTTSRLENRRHIPHSFAKKSISATHPNVFYRTDQRGTRLVQPTNPPCMGRPGRGK